MLLSREAEYAIQALLRLTNHDMNTFIPINILANELNIPFYYLSKILQKLVKHGFLNSHKGPRGGVAFAIDPEQMSVLDIVIAVDGDKIFAPLLDKKELKSILLPEPIHDLGSPKNWLCAIAQADNYKRFGFGNICKEDKI